MLPKTERGNEKKHYEVGYKEVKKSRKVTAVSWSIAKKNQPKLSSFALPEIKKLDSEVHFHKIKEIADFCNAYEKDIDGINYLLNVTDLNVEKDTLKLTFASDFFKSQCEQNIILQDRLVKFFKVKYVDFI